MIAPTTRLPIANHPINSLCTNNLYENNCQRYVNSFPSSQIGAISVDKTDKKDINNPIANEPYVFIKRNISMALFSLLTLSIYFTVQVLNLPYLLLLSHFVDCMYDKEALCIVFYLYLLLY